MAGGGASGLGALESVRWWVFEAAWDENNDNELPPPLPLFDGPDEDELSDEMDETLDYLGAEKGA